MPVITRFELKLVQQPLREFADQPVYMPPRSGSMSIHEMRGEQVFLLDNILAKYANVGPFRKNIAIPQVDDGAVSSIYKARRIPIFGAKHTANLEAISLSTESPYNAVLEFNLPGGKACRVIGDIIREVSPQWTPDAAASYNALPAWCKTLISPGYKPAINPDYKQQRTTK